jgi:hypothetical protein
VCDVGATDVACGHDRFDFVGYGVVEVVHGVVPVG